MTVFYLVTWDCDVTLMLLDFTLDFKIFASDADQGIKKI